LNALKSSKESDGSLRLILSQLSPASTLFFSRFFQLLKAVLHLLIEWLRERVLLVKLLEEGVTSQNFPNFGMLKKNVD
jgi:hypothetical protein